MRRLPAQPFVLALAALAACARQQTDPANAVPVDGSVTDRAVGVDDPAPGEDLPAPPEDNPQPPEDLPTPRDDAPSDSAPPPVDGMAGCAAGLTDCTGSCRDLAVDPNNCGMCGRMCAAGQSCAAGMCACPTGQMLCGTACLDTSSNPMNCGMCARACPAGQSCASGACTLTCPTGQTNCGGACRTLPTDAMNCGGCGRMCPAGNQCVSNACVAGAPRGPDFRVQWLGSNNCRSSEHSGVTGADRGGIALSNGQIFYTGQGATGRFNAASLEGVTAGTRYDAMVSNLRTGVVYTFVDAMGAPLAPPGGIATALREIDGTTGLLTPRTVALSAPVPIMGAATGSTVGFFSGWDRLLVMANGRSYNIDLPSGAVLDLGSSPLPARSPCGGWAFSGVAELSAGIAYITFVSDPTTISRRPLPMGPVTTVSQFVSLSNMCGFTVAPGAQRWYFHHSRSSQLGGSAGAAETIGYCDASTSVAGPACPPTTASCGGICRFVNTDSANCGRCGNACGAGQSCSMGACVGAPLRYARSALPMAVPFVDACTASGHSTLLTSVDDALATTTVPFESRYWGVPVAMGSTLHVSSNGYLVVGGPAPVSRLSGTIPQTAAPNNVIAVQWRDLRTTADGVCVATVGIAPDRRFAVHWSNVTNFDTGGSLSFEAVFNERDAAIDLVYAAMTGAQTASVGLENGAGTDAIGACPSGSTVTSCIIPANTRWRFTPVP